MSVSKHWLLSFYYCLFLREQFSYSVVWCGIVPEPTARAYISPDKTIGKLFSREKTIIYLVHNIPILDIKEKHIQIQHYNNNNYKIYNVALYLHCQTWPCWQQTTARVFFKGDKSWQKYIKITRENLYQRHSPRGK
jgi:hypothetical protein